MKKTALISAAALVASGFAMTTATPALAQSATSGQICGDYTVTDGFNRTRAGRACINVVKLNFGNGEGNKVTIVRGNATGNNGVKLRCTLRDGTVFSDRNAGRTIPGTGSRATCTPTFGNGGNRREGPSFQMR